MFLKLGTKFNLKMPIGDRIKKIRGSLSREEFALKLGIDKSTIQRYENDDNIPKGDILQQIHDEFNVNINWLLTGNGDPGISNDKDIEYVHIDVSVFTKVLVCRGCNKWPLSSQVIFPSNQGTVHPIFVVCKGVQTCYTNSSQYEETTNWSPTWNSG